MASASGGRSTTHAGRPSWKADCCRPPQTAAGVTCCFARSTPIQVCQASRDLSVPRPHTPPGCQSGAVGGASRCLPDEPPVEGPGTEGGEGPPAAAELLPLLLPCGPMPRTSLTCSRDRWRAAWSTCKQPVHQVYGQAHWKCFCKQPSPCAVLCLLAVHACACPPAPGLTSRHSSTVQDTRLEHNSLQADHTCYVTS